jgi:hypothetical protein
MQSKLASLFIGLGLCTGLAAQTTRPAGTVLVTNEAEFRAAANAASRHDLNILLDRKITLTQEVKFWSSMVVRLIGTTPASEIAFTKTFDGSWAAENGVYFQCRQSVVQGITFSNFEGGGVALKICNTESAVVANCTFLSIGTRVVAPKTMPAGDSNVCWYTVPLYAGGGGLQDVTIIDNQFTNCAYGDNYSHCIYTSDVRSAYIANNKFKGCGQSIQASKGRFVTVTGNTVTEPKQDPSYRTASVVYYYPMAALIDGNCLWMFNVWKGKYEVAFSGNLDWRKQFVDYNDYSGMDRPTKWPGWYVNYGVGNMTLDWWNKQGMDRHSKFPAGW